MNNSKTDWNRLRTQTDADIEQAVAQDPDTFSPGDSFWDDAELVIPVGKQQITLKLDPDVIDFFKKQGRGYNTRINAVLKSYIQKMTRQA